MSLFRSIIVTVFIALPAAAHGVLQFTNGLWWNGRAFERRTMYSVDNVFREQWKGEVARTIDLGGRYVVPPFADAHSHVFAEGTDVPRQLARHFRAGVFYVSNPNSSSRLALPIRAQLNTPETVDVTYSFGGITASGGHPVQLYEGMAGRGPFAGWTAADMPGQTYFIVDSIDGLSRQWPRILEPKPDFIKTYLEHSEEFEARRQDAKFYGRRGLDPKILSAVVKRAHAAGLRVATHVATAADFRNAIAAGADQIAHLPLERITPRDAEAVVRARATIVTTTVSHRPTDGILDLDAIHAANLALLHSAGARIVLGTDNGDRTILDEADNVRRLTGWSNAEVLNLLTTETVKEIFPKRKVGTLGSGAEASLLALDGNPIEDWSAIRRVAVRVKQGHLIEVAPEKPSVAEVLAPIAVQRGAAAALDEYARLQREQPDRYVFGEAPLNQLGYVLLRHKKTADAVAVFEHNARLFPDSANVWDSLGEGLLAAGDREGALRSYRKSLELNPHNRNAEEMLKKIGEP